MKLDFGYYTNPENGINLVVKTENGVKMFNGGNPKESMEYWKELAALCNDAIDELKDKMK